MKKAILVLALFAGIHMAAEAQQGQRGKQTMEQREKMTPEQLAERHANRLQKTLNLTDAQRQAIYESDIATAKQAAPLKDQQKETREQVRSLQKQREEKLKSILTADQYTKLEVMKKERRGKMVKRHAERKMQGQNMRNNRVVPSEVK